MISFCSDIFHKSTVPGGTNAVFSHIHTTAKKIRQDKTLLQIEISVRKSSIKTAIEKSGWKHLLAGSVFFLTCSSTTPHS
jgi:hypothetical protein